MHDGTLGKGVARVQAARERGVELTRGDFVELKCLRTENAGLRMKRNAFKRSVILWVKKSTM